jgi:hypothetical protein
MTAEVSSGQGSGRQQRRIEVGLAMTVSGKESDGTPFVDTVQSGNVSRSGAAFTTYRTLSLGSEVDVVIPRRPGEHGEDADFSSRARIVRIIPGAREREFVVGVQFLDRRFHRVFVSETTT